MQLQKRRFFATAWRLPIAGVVLGAMLAGCAGLGQPASPQERVKVRAEARWKALAVRDFDTAYGYLAPSVRAVKSKLQYQARFGGAALWKSVNAVDVQCGSPDKCVATIRIEAHLAVPMAGRPLTGAPPSVTELEETWLKEGGEWWIFVKL